ncbi:hypothetical protein BD289DRAFT_38450 [Coniella lustricola]|uniref:Uncharacterized protein n=1 Tax=Coniella lustricola TaxID=2025994 RepID=A0A2T3AIR6_9PEZI|nr:hypothetical protein BD289DRAFT_38450 [Coniella lustricola]
MLGTLCVLFLLPSQISSSSILPQALKAQKSASASLFILSRGELNVIQAHDSRVRLPITIEPRSAPLAHDASPISRFEILSAAPLAMPTHAVKLQVCERGAPSRDLDSFQDNSRFVQCSTAAQPRPECASRTRGNGIHLVLAVAQSLQQLPLFGLTLSTPIATVVFSMRRLIAMMTRAKEREGKRKSFASHTLHRYSRLDASAMPSSHGCCTARLVIEVGGTETDPTIPLSRANLQDVENFGSVRSGR